MLTTATLNQVVQEASAQMYQGGAGPQAGADQGFQGGAEGAQQGGDNKTDDNIQDADFEEVK